MLRGKYWIFPDKTVLNVSMSEHVIRAVNFMLNLPEERAIKLLDSMQSDIFEAATWRSLQGKYADAAKFILEKGDPRVWAIKNNSWVRVAKEKFYAAKWDAATIKHVAQSDYFKATDIDDEDWLELIDLSDDSSMMMSVKDFKRRGR